MPFCGKCGNQVSPNAKFCGRCGAPLQQAAPAPTAPPTRPIPQQVYNSAPPTYSPPPPAYTAPPPPPPPQMYNPTPPPPPVFSPAPPPPPPPIQPTYNAPPPMYSPPPPPASQMQQPPMYYPAPQPAPMPPPAPAQVMPPPAPQAPPQNVPQMQPTAQMPPPCGEETVGVILFRKTKSLGRYDTFAGVVTSRRLILAQLTSQMLTDAAQQAREQAKAEGKGFFGQWADQLRNTFGFTNRYLTMPPNAIIAETPGNFALDNNSIYEVKLHLTGHNNDNYSNRGFVAEFKTNQGTFKYSMAENSEFTDLLKRVYGERVRMPFGYFSKSVNIHL